MITTTLKSTAALAILAQLPGASPPYAVPVAPAPAVDRSIAATIAEWRAIGQTDALPFDSYARFLLANPGWPNEAANRRAATRSDTPTAGGRAWKGAAAEICAVRLGHCLAAS